MTISRPRILLLTASNLGPYHKARYEELATTLDLTVCKTPISEYERPWSEVQAANVTFQLVAPFEANMSTLQIWKRIHALMVGQSPDAVVTVGYNGRFVWLTTCIARLLKIPTLLYLVGWSEQRKRSFLKETFKRLYCTFFYSEALVTGSRARDYAAQLGIPYSRIFTIGNVIDNDHFAERRKLSPQLVHLATKPYFLTVARLSKEKNLNTLIEAYSQYVLDGGSWHLVIAGTGPEEEKLRATIPESITDQVKLLGWVGYDELPALYQHAACFILPSLMETWGLVANEAMAAGLPILLSTQCGCLPELCIEGVNGYSFAPTDTATLVRLMHKVEQLSHERLCAMGDKSREIVGGFTLNTWRDAFTNAVEQVIATSQT